MYIIMVIFKLCQMSLHTEFQLLIMFGTRGIYTPTPATKVRTCFTCQDHILNFIFFYSAPNLIYRPTHKKFCYMIQNRTSITLFIICVYKCLMNIFSKLNLPIMFQHSYMDFSLHILKCVLQITKSLKSDSIYKMCLCLK